MARSWSAVCCLDIFGARSASSAICRRASIFRRSASVITTAGHQLSIITTCRESVKWTFLSCLPKVLSGACIPYQGATGLQRVAGLPRFRARPYRVAPHRSNVRVIQSTRAHLPGRPRQSFPAFLGRACPPRGNARAAYPDPYLCFPSHGIVCPPPSPPKQAPVRAAIIQSSSSCPPPALHFLPSAALPHLPAAAPHEVLPKY